MNKYYIGVDGGGTKTDVLCADENGNVVGQSTTGPTNLTSTSVGAASFNLLEGIRQATENLPEGGLEDGNIEIVCMAMGLAGMDTIAEQQSAQSVFAQVLNPYNIDNFFLVNDSLIALANATDSENAAVLISGTGSVCYGKNNKGETARTSGLDYLLSDQGSGYFIGRQVLRIAVKSFDGRAQKSILEELVCKHFNISQISDLKSKVYNPLLSKIEIANLAPLCFEAFNQGDEAAAGILEYAANELFIMAETVIKKLGIRDDEFDFVFAGSVMRSQQIYEMVSERLKAEFPKMRAVDSDNDPVHGALKIAMRGVV